MTVLTILVLSAVSSTILEERMASNIRDRQTAFQRAEQAFKVAEAALANSPYDPFVASAFSNTCDSGNASRRRKSLTGQLKLTGIPRVSMQAMGRAMS